MSTTCCDEFGSFGGSSTPLGSFSPTFSSTPKMFREARQNQSKLQKAEEMLREASRSGKKGVEGDLLKLFGALFVAFRVS